MTIETNLNQSPFFDDFDETKNFHRVLFRPGYAVQARELTQIQTILQNQIERFASDVYTDGTVINGCTAEAQNWSYVKLRDKDANNRVILLGDFFASDGFIDDIIVTGETTGVTARLLDAVDGSEAAAPDHLSVFVSYTNSGTDTTTKTFADNEVLIFRAASDAAFKVAANTITTSAVGDGVGAHVSNGTIYHKGNFIKVSEQSKIVSKYTKYPNVRVGLETKESIIDSFQDSSLLDNASGATNFSAPGASRLKLTPTIATRELEDTSAADSIGFTPLFDVQDGIIVRDYYDAKYSGLGDELAQRTYEESGDYSLDPFKMNVEEHLDNGVNGGVYNVSEADNAATFTQQGNADKLVVEVEPSVGYVQGYRVETIDKLRQSIDKAKTFSTRENLVVGQGIGNYIIVDELVGLWDFTSSGTVQLQTTAQNAISTRTFSTGSASGTNIGTAKIRGIQYHSGTKGTSTGQYRIYLSDISMNADKKFVDVRSLFVNGTPKSFADVVTVTNIGAKLYDTTFDTMVFPIQSVGVKTLSSTQFVSRKKNSVTVATAGTFTLSIPTAAAGGVDKMNDPTVTLADRRNFIIVSKEDEITANYGAYISSASPSSITSNGTTVLTGHTGTAFSTDFKVGDYMKIGASANVYEVTAITDADTMTITGPNGAIPIGSTNGVYRKFYPAGHVFDLQVRGGFSNSSETGHTISLGDTFNSTFPVDVYFDVLRTSAVPESKIVKKSRYIELNTTSHGSTSVGPWSLGVPDAWKLEAVYIGTAGSVTVADTLATADFDLDDGQNGGSYGLSKLVKKSTSTLDTTNKGILVKFSHFTRDRSNGIGFLTVDSYPVDDSNSTADNKIATAEIPTYETVGGVTYDLRDNVDFRPAYANTCEPKAVADIANAPVNPSAVSANFDLDGTHGGYPPTPDQNFQSDVQVYLPRIDIMTLRPNGEFDIITGIPSESPQKPVHDPADSMQIGTINIPPYPSLSPTAAGIYDRFDYQVNLEQNNNRRYTMEDIRELDREFESTRKQVEINRVDIEALKTSVIRPDDPVEVAEPPKEVVITNPNPLETYFNTMRSGDLISEESPIRPIPKIKDIDLVVQNGSLTNMSTRTGSGNLFKRAVKNSTTKDILTQRFATNRKTVTVTTKTPVKTFNGTMSLSHPLCYLKQTKTNYDSKTFSKMKTAYRKAGIDYSGLAEYSDLSAIGKNTFHNSYTIKAHKSQAVTCNNLKPNTRVYARFDGRDVSNYVYMTNKKMGTALVTDSNGKLQFRFKLPNDKTMKFMGLKHLLEISDVVPPVKNGISSGKVGSTTRCGQYYYAPLNKSGITTGKVSSSITNLKVGELKADSTQTNISIKEIDNDLPEFLSQAFIVPASKVDGVFLKNIRLYFAQKPSSANSSVRLQVRECDNNGPTDVLISESDVITQASITASSTSHATATEFSFAEEPFLKSGKKYAFTVIPVETKSEFELWTAVKNKKDITSNKSAYAVPGLGDLYGSATGNVWQLLPDEALKFNIRVGSYNKSESSSVIFTNGDVEFLNVNAITPFGEATSNTGFQTDEVVRGTCLMTITHSATVTIAEGDVLKSKVAHSVPNYGDYLNTNTDTTPWANGTVRAVVSEPTTTTTLVQIDAFGDFTTSAANTNSTIYRDTDNIGTVTTYAANTVQGIISFVNTDYGRIRLYDSTGTTTHGFSAGDYIRGQERGAGALITEVANIDVDSIQLIAPHHTPKFTTLAWGMKTTNIAGTTDSSFSPIDGRSKIILSKDQKRIYSKSNRDTKSLLIQATATTLDTRIAPTINLDDLSVEVEQERINATTTNEQYPAGGAAARYVSKVVPASRPDGDAAERLTVHITGYIPKESGVEVWVRAANNSDSEKIEDKIFTKLQDYWTTPVGQSVLGDLHSRTRKLYRIPSGTTAALSSSVNTLIENTSVNKTIEYKSGDGGVYKGIDTIQYKIVLTRPDGTGRDYTPQITTLTSMTYKKPV